MVSSSTQITALFIVLGLTLWYVSTLITESTIIQIAVLIGAGVLAPTIINEWRENQEA